MSTKPRIVHQTKAKRARRQLWIKAGVWVFVIVFAFSVAGGILAIRVVAR